MKFKNHSNMKKDIDFLKKIKKLFLVSFKKKISLQFLKWRYLDNTLDDFLFFNEFVNEEIIASYSASPLEIYIDKKKYLAALSMTTMTHPKAQGKGLFPKLAKGLFKEMSKKNYKLIVAFANNKSHSTFIKKLGWKDIYEVPTMILSRENLRKYDSSKEFSLLRDNEFSLDYSKLKVQSKFAFHRDNNFFKWRYLYNPENNYDVFSLKSKNSEFISSTIVTKIFNDSLDIVDMQVRNQKEGLFLLNEIFDHYSKFGIDNFSIWCPINHFMHEILEKLGFLNSAPISYFIGKKLDEEAKIPKFEDFDNWYIQMGDSDVF